MNVDEALRRFAEDDGLPREAMAWALDNWRTASPRFIGRLRAFVAGGDRTEATESQLFFIAHLCGQMRETRAYEPLCRLIAEDPDLENSLGDAMTETLARRPDQRVRRRRRAALDRDRVSGRAMNSPAAPTLSRLAIWFA